MNGGGGPSRILEHNAEAGPSCIRMSQTSSGPRPLSDNAATRSGAFLPPTSPRSKQSLKITSLGPSALLPGSHAHDDARAVGFTMSPELSCASNSPDPTYGFEPLSPIIFVEPFGGGGGGRGKSAQPEMAERPAVGSGILSSGGRAVVGVPPMRSHAPWASSSKRINAQPTSYVNLPLGHSTCLTAVAPAQCRLPHRWPDRLPRPKYCLTGNPACSDQSISP